MRICQRYRQADRRQTDVTLRFPLNAVSVMVILIGLHSDDANMNSRSIIGVKQALKQLALLAALLIGEARYRSDDSKLP